MANVSISLKASDVKRLARATRRDELLPQYRAPDPIGPRQSGGLLYATTSSTITAKSGSTLGTGTATLDISSPSHVVSAVPGSGTTVTVESIFSTTVASGTLVIIGIVNNKYTLISVAC